MLLKYNAAVPSTKSAVPYYANIFDAEIVKDGSDNGHAYIKLFGQISLHLHSIGKLSLNSSYLILRFEKSERALFDKTISTIRDLVDVEIIRNEREMIWGTTLFQFIDRYNFRWVLEIDT